MTISMQEKRPMTGTHSKRNGAPVQARDIYGLIRVSDLKQEKSAQTQEHDIREYAESIPGTFRHCRIDEDTSGRSTQFMDRLEAPKLLRECSKGDVVVMTKLDRLGRNMRDILNTIDEFQRRGIHLIVMEMAIDGQPLDLSTLVGKVTVWALGFAAEIEGYQNSERTKAGMKWRKETGQIYCGRPRYGYKRIWRPTDRPGKKRRLVCYDPHPQERALIKEIYEWSTRGQYVEAIVRHLREQNIRTADGAQWTRFRVYRVIAWYKEQIAKTDDPWKNDLLTNC